MSNYLKGFIIGFIVSLVILCFCYLIHTNVHDTFVFMSQSVIDNAIFCAMFIAVVLITGISC